MIGFPGRMARLLAASMALSPFNNALAQYLTGADRAQFIAGAVNSCIAGYGRGDTGVIPRPFFEQYCRCYANGVADRVPASDLENDAVADPIARAESRRCYNAIKEEALQTLQKRSRP